MPKLSLFAGAALVAVMLAAAPQISVAKSKEAAGAKASDLAVFRALLDQGYEKARKGDFAGAAESVQSAVDSPAFPQMDADARFSTLYLLAMTELYSDQAQKAYDHMVEASRLSPDSRDGDYWLLLCDITLALDKDEEATDALTTVATTYPDALKGSSSDLVYRVTNAADRLKDDNMRYQRLLIALRAANWTPENPFWTAEDLWFDLFSIYAGKGDEARARELLAGFTEPGSIMKLQVEKRYAAFAPADTDAYPKALDHALETTRALAAAHPDRIQGPVAMAEQLMEINRLPEALKILDDALAKIDAAPKDKPAFTDLDDYLNWTYDQQSRVLRLMGHGDDAVAALRKGRDTGSDGQVSQRINLADLLGELGRPQDALAEVKDMTEEGSSPYGIMSAEEARVCAYAQTSDKTGLDKSLTYMRAHADDGQAPLQSALLCVNDLDGLAKSIIAQLDDPDQRSIALSDLQTYLPEPALSVWAKTLQARRAELLARADLKAAIARYGVIRSYPIFRGDH